MSRRQSSSPFRLSYQAIVDAGMRVAMAESEKAKAESGGEQFRTDSASGQEIRGERGGRREEGRMWITLATGTARAEAGGAAWQQARRQSGSGGEGARALWRWRGDMNEQRPMARAGRGGARW